MCKLAQATLPTSNSVDLIIHLILPIYTHYLYVDINPYFSIQNKGALAGLLIDLW